MKNTFKSILLVFAYLNICTIFCSTNIFAAEVVVKFKSVPSAGELEMVKKLPQVQSIERFFQISIKGGGNYFDRAYTIIGKDNFSASALQKALEKLSVVESIEPITPFEVETFALNPSGKTVTKDSYVDYQWGFHSNGQVTTRDKGDAVTLEKLTGVGYDIDILRKINTFEKDIKKDLIVAVLDSGIDLEHGDLYDNIYKNIAECVPNTDEETKAIRPYLLPFNPKEDKDGNGFIGDCMGWNFTGKGNLSYRPSDDAGHGTHVSGIIAAVRNNGKGVAGLSNRIKILPIKVLVANQKVQDPTQMVAFTDKVSKAILYAVKMKVDVINMSLGWPKLLDFEYVREAFKAARAANIAIVVAAGNNNIESPVYPCAYDGVICVGASAINGTLSIFSNYGGIVDIVAPGEQILSTVPAKLEPDYFSVAGYDIKNGTSQASPYVAGIVAILKGINPEISLDDIYVKLLSTAKPLEQSSQKGKSTLGGLVQLQAAIEKQVSSFVMPVFKGLYSVSYNKNDGNFIFSVPIKSYGTPVSGINVSVAVGDRSVVSLENANFQIEALSKGETTAVEISGTILDSSKSSLQPVIVTIEYSGKKYFYKHNVNFIRNITPGDSDILSLPIAYSGKMDEIVTVLKNGVRLRLRSVDDKWRLSSMPDFYMLKQAAADAVSKNYELILFKSKDNVLQDTARASFDPKEIFMSFSRIDLNYDKKQDYLVVTCNSESGGCDYATEFHYYYLDSSLKSIIKHPYLAFKNPAIYLSAGESFIPTVTPWGLLATPVVHTNGELTKLDYNNDPWVSETRSVRPHIFYVNVDANKGEFVLRTLDNYIFYKKLEQDKLIQWNENMFILGSFFQSAKSLLEGSAAFHVSIGKGNLRKDYVLDVGKDAKYKLIPLDMQGIRTEDYLRRPVINLDGGEPSYFASTFLSGLQNDILGSYIFIDPRNPAIVYNRGNYSHPVTYDKLKLPLSGFIKDGNSYSFYETKYSIALKITGDVNKSFIRPINKVSSIPGNLFSESFYPVVATSGSEKFPAFYFDATQIHAGHVYVMIADEVLGLVSPMDSNFFVPDSCSAMNPAKINGDESVTFICATKDRSGKIEAQIRFIPIHY